MTSKKMTFDVLNLHIFIFNCIFLSFLSVIWHCTALSILRQIRNQQKGQFGWQCKTFLVVWQYKCLVFWWCGGSFSSAKSFCPSRCGNIAFPRHPSLPSQTTVSFASSVLPTSKAQTPSPNHHPNFLLIYPSVSGSRLSKTYRDRLKGVHNWLSNR